MRACAIMPSLKSTPDAERRRERGQEIAGAASELEHAGACGDQELEVEQILVVEKGRAGEPLPRARARLRRHRRRMACLRADMVFATGGYEGETASIARV